MDVKSKPLYGTEKKISSEKNQKKSEDVEKMLGVSFWVTLKKSNKNKL